MLFNCFLSSNKYCVLSMMTIPKTLSAGLMTVISVFDLSDCIVCGLIVLTVSYVVWLFGRLNLLLCNYETVF